MNDYSISIHPTIHQLNENELNTVVRQSSHGTALSQFGWFAAIEESRPVDPVYVCVNKNGSLVGFIPLFKQDVLLGTVKKLGDPWPGFNEPVVLTDKDVVIQKLIDGITSLRRGQTVADEIRFFSNSHLQYTPFFRNRGYRPEIQGCRFEIPLTRSYRNVVSQMSRSRREDYSNVEESGTTVERLDPTNKNLRAFYTTYKEHVDRVNGNTLPLELFTELSRHYGDYFVLLRATNSGEAVGYKINVRDPDRSVIHFIWLAMREDSYEYYPREAIYSHCIKQGIANGFDRIDLGGTEPDLTNGSFRYKNQLGAEMKPIVTLTRVRGGALARSVGSGIKALISPFQTG